jgi:hypothetical protein
MGRLEGTAVMEGLCNKPVRKATNGVDRGFCSRPVKHHGRHTNNTCTSCGVIKNKENAFPRKQITGICKKCANDETRELKARRAGFSSYQEKIAFAKDKPAEPLRRKEQLSAAGRKGGAVAVVTGQIFQIRTPERSRQGGLTSGFLHKTNGTGIFAPGMAAKGGITGAHNRWHVAGKTKIPGCILCENENAFEDIT